MGWNLTLPSWQNVATLVPMRAFPLKEWYIHYFFRVICWPLFEWTIITSKKVRMPCPGFEPGTISDAGGSHIHNTASRQNIYIRFTRLNPLEHFQDIKWSAYENGLGTSVLCIHADTNHKSSAIHQHITHWIQSVAWIANQMPFPLLLSTVVDKKNATLVVIPTHIIVEKWNWYHSPWKSVLFKIM